MSDKSGKELLADCHGVTEVNLITALGFYSMTSSIKSMDHLQRAHGLVTSITVKVFPGALQTQQKIGGWREALENEMNLRTVRPIIDLLVRNIWWVRTPHHIAIVGILRIWW